MMCTVLEPVGCGLLCLVHSILIYHLRWLLYIATVLCTVTYSWTIGHDGLEFCVILFAFFVILCGIVCCFYVVFNENGDRARDFLM